MPFAEFLRQFRALLPGASNPQRPVARVKRALAYVFGTKRKQLDTFRPTQLEARDFIDYLLSAINLEKKALSADRNLALSKILAYNETPGKSCFADIDPHVFAFQLALRIREPSLINQAAADVCGEASLMIFVAKNTPSVFADYAISLMRNGRGKLHNLTIEPSYHTVSGSGPRRGMSEADVVTVGSLGLSLVKFFEGSGTGAVCGWLRDAGFGNVVDEVINLSGLPGDAKLRENLAKAETAVSAKKLVIFAIDGDLVKKLQVVKASLAQSEQHKSAAGLPSIVVTRSLEPRTNPLRGTDHWVLVSSIEIKAQTVVVKLYSWKDSMTGTFDTNTFLSYYGGFIVAEPPPPPKKISIKPISTEDKSSAEDKSSEEDESSDEDEWSDEDESPDE